MKNVFSFPIVSYISTSSGKDDTRNTLSSSFYCRISENSMSFHYLFIYLHEGVSPKRRRQPSQTCSGIIQDEKINITSTVFKADLCSAHIYVCSVLSTFGRHCSQMPIAGLYKLKKWMKPSSWRMKASTSTASTHLRAHKLQPPDLGMEDESIALPPREKEKQK